MAKKEPGDQERRDRLVRDRRESPVMALQREMNALFENFVSGKNPMSFGRFEESLRAFTPRMDITESETEVRVTTELPGMAPGDVRISVDHDLLTVEGEKKIDARENHKGYYRMERSYGAFQRTLRLPAAAAVDKAEATFKNGVLSLIFPKKKESAQSVRDIPISPAPVDR